MQVQSRLFPSSKLNSFKNTLHAEGGICRPHYAGDLREYIQHRSLLYILYIVIPRFDDIMSRIFLLYSVP